MRPRYMQHPLIETGAPRLGKMVIGTVKGDIHDIGKNLVAMMLEGAGFEVIDLGINTDADEFINALDEAVDVAGEILGRPAHLEQLLLEVASLARVDRDGEVIDARTEQRLDLKNESNSYSF